MKSIFTLCFSLFAMLASGQNMTTPVDWSFEVEAVDDHYVFKATATIDKDWVVYSQHTSEGGPVPLAFSYSDPSVLVGETIEKSEAIKEMSDLFDLEVIKFKKKAVFEQSFLKKEGIKNFSGELTFMCCDGSRCLPPTIIPFDVKI